MTIVHNDVNDHFTKYCDDNYDNVDNDPFSKYCDDNYNNDDNDYFSKYCDDNYDNDIKGDIYQIYQIPNTKYQNTKYIAMTIMIMILRPGAQGGPRRAQCEVDPYNHTRFCI